MKHPSPLYALSALQQLRCRHSALSPALIRLTSTSPVSQKPPTAVVDRSAIPDIRINSKQSKPIDISSPLAILPLSSVLRSYLIMAMSSSPVLLSLCTATLRGMLHSNSRVLDVSRNPLIHWLLRQTFYAQFCAGENQKEVRRFLGDMHGIGYHGLILEYAREVLDDGTPGRSEEEVQKDIDMWITGLLDTIGMVNDGDFVGLKWSGMGPEAFEALKAGQSPPPNMAKAIKDLCDAAAAKGVMLLPAAEPQNAQAAVDAWTLQQAEKYNKNGHAVVYNTYQAYLKSTPETLSRHLALAAEKGFTLGVKLVRGAYLGTERRDLIQPTKEDTDHAYDSIAESLLKQQYSGPLKAPENGSSTFPSINIVLATHNLESVDHVRALRDAQKVSGEDMVKLSYAQLQGMADEVSCLLVKAQRVMEEEGLMEKKDPPKVFKCVTWGTLTDCLHYLLRRAAENKDAMGRTKMTRRAMGAELGRRMRKSVGLA